MAVKRYVFNGQPHDELVLGDVTYFGGDEFAEDETVVATLPAGLVSELDEQPADDAPGLGESVQVPQPPVTAEPAAPPHQDPAPGVSQAQAGEVQRPGEAVNAQTGERTPGGQALPDAGEQPEAG